MPTKYQRYEAVVKLNNEAVVPYHNINTGLKKFHRFVCDKFENKWIFYTVRRKETKEIIGTFKNDLSTQIRAIRVYLPKQRNNNNTGYFVRFPFERYQALINRNLFFADKVVIDFSDDWIIISENIFNKAIANAIEELKAYFIEQGHNVAHDEIKLSEFLQEPLLTTKKEFNGTQPLEDYP